MIVLDYLYSKLTPIFRLIKLNVFLSIFIIGFLIYGNSLFNGFIGDDVIQILTNPTVHSLANIPALFTGSTFSDGAATLRGNYYKPLLTIAYAFIYAIFGSNAFGFHLLQVILFIINSWLVYKLLQKWFSKNLSLFAALLFLVHPINSEAVLYISSLQDVLFMFFGLTGMLVYINKIYSKYNLFVSYILFFLSILSKETGVLFFIILLIYQLLYDKKTFWKSIIFSSSIGIFYIYLKFFLAQTGFTINHFATITRLTFTERLIQIPLIIVFYIKTFLLPIDLIAVQNWVVRTLNFNYFYLPLLFCLLLIFIFGWSFIKIRNKKTLSTFIFFTIWFGIGLLLHLQIIALDATVADRWFYFPIIGLIALVLMLIKKLMLYYKNNHKLLVIILFVILSIFSSRSFLRTFDYRNDYALASHDLKIQPDNFVLHDMVGLKLQQQGDLNGAKEQFLEAIRIDPGNNIAWHNLGFLYENLGVKDKALYKLSDYYYQNAIKTGDDPNSYINLAELRLFKENFNLKDTKNFLEQALSKYPNNPKLLAMYAIASYKLGDKDQANRTILKAIKIQPQEQQFIKIYQLIISNQDFNLVP